MRPFKVASTRLKLRRYMFRCSIISKMVPRRRFELLRAYAHHPLKMACLPDSTTSAFTTHKITDFVGAQFWQGRQESNPRPAVLETAALPSELHPCIVRFQVPLGRFERPTRGLGNRCSILLSYRGRKLRLVPRLPDYVPLWRNDPFHMYSCSRRYLLFRFFCLFFLFRLRCKCSHSRSHGSDFCAGS